MWATIRKLRFTASNFGQIIRAAKRNRLTESLKKRILSAYNLERRAPIQWGITHERVGVNEFCKASGVTVLPKVNDVGGLFLKRTHDYWHQIQGQLFLTGTE